MDSFEPELTPWEFLTFCVQHLKGYIGLEFLYILIYQPGMFICSTQLRCMLVPVLRPVWEYDNPARVKPRWDFYNYQLPEHPVETLDEKAIIQIKQERARLRKRCSLASARQDHALLSNLKAEIAALDIYLRKNTYHNKPRLLHDRLHLDYLIVKIDLETVYNKLLTLSPRHAAYMKAHLHTGHRFCWKTEEAVKR